MTKMDEKISRFREANPNGQTKRKVAVYRSEENTV